MLDTIFWIALVVVAAALLALALYLYGPQLRAMPAEHRKLVHLQDTLIHNWGVEEGMRLFVMKVEHRTTYWRAQRSQRFAALLGG